MKSERLIYNQMIVDKLQELIKRYPDWRFGQILINCDILEIQKSNYYEDFVGIKDPFYIESKTIWDRMCKNKFFIS